jgi:hypothetical protein
MDADVPWPLGAPAFWISRSSWSIFSTRASQNPKRIDKFRQAPDDFGLVHSVMITMIAHAGPNDWETR